MKQLNWYQIFGQTHTIPDGRTVTPTDDIQIWLNCADIWDKAYTTLAEVLADTDTLSALIASENAVDYMVRSTTWTSTITTDSTAMSYIGLNNYCANTLLADSTWHEAICNSEYFESVLNVKAPAMTSNTTPSGVCSASNYRSGNEAYKAFDNTDSGYWFENNNNSTSNAWVEYDFPSAEHIYFVKIYGNELSVAGASPVTTANVVIQSFDGSSWNNISEVVAIRTPNGSGSSTTPYSSNLLVNETNSKYRILFYQKSTGCRCGLHRLQFYGREDV